MDAIINDKTAALYGTFYALGAIPGPLLGSAVYSLLNNDWWYTCDVFAIASCIYSVIFLVFNVLPDIHKEKEQRGEMAEKLLKKETVKRIININVIDEANEGEEEDLYGTAKR